MKLSAVVITKNEARHIHDCLKSLSFCDEVIVVDDFSQDRTAAIAKSCKAKVFLKSLAGDFSAQRNFALDKVKGEWVLFVDADELVSPKLADEIKSRINTGSTAGFFLKRQDFFLGRCLQHGETGNLKLLRLAKKGSGIWKRPVHEYWQVKGKVLSLKNPLIHKSHSDISQFLQVINKYTSLEAAYRKKEGKKSGLWELIIFPPVKFIKNYLVLLGFLDGFPGFVMAYLMSLHSLILRVKMRR